MDTTTNHNHALYEAFKAKDARFDGRFFVGISSTGIYCRPVLQGKTAEGGELHVLRHRRRSGTSRISPLSPVSSGVGSRVIRYRFYRQFDSPGDQDIGTELR